MSVMCSLCTSGSTGSHLSELLDLKVNTVVLFFAAVLVHYIVIFSIINS